MSSGDAPSSGGASGMGGMIVDLIRKNPQMFSGAQNNSPVNQNTGMGGMFSKFFSNPRMYNQYFRDKENFIDENFNDIDDREEAAMGGRIGYGAGSRVMDFFTPKGKGAKGILGTELGHDGIMEIISLLSSSGLFAKGGRAGFKDGGLTEYESYRLKNMGYDTKGGTVLEPFGGLSILKDILRVNKAMGGMTSRTPMEEGGIMDLGGMEKDYRAEGGFVPIGKKEKADDVPARLSVNEFVFTADAVRNAGGGDIDKGAEVMENMMKNLEAGGQVSEESQGMQGARDMFQTSQSLEGVM
jgi:hypothetical protein